MLDQLAEVKIYEDKRREHENIAASYQNMRDLWILHAFEAGNRQRDIGHVCGKSESTIKHIIATQRKSNEVR
jgi:hypothetical protein